MNEATHKIMQSLYIVFGVDGLVSFLLPFLASVGGPSESVTFVGHCIVRGMKLLHRSAPSCSSNSHLHRARLTLLPRRITTEEVP
eukprot:scaffold5559_cov193-Skeletonema_marinoi.AAC.16